jgi:hypothetical protein
VLTPKLLLSLKPALSEGCIERCKVRHYGFEPFFFGIAPPLEDCSDGI